MTQITQAELARLIRLLGMLGSSSDGEALNAARLAARWLRDKGTDWQTLLEPPAETGVVAVGVAAADAASEQREQAAYHQGYNAGFQEAAKTTEARVQAALAQAARVQAASHGAATRSGQHGAWTGLGGAYSGLGPFAQSASGQTAQGPPSGPVGASAARSGGAGSGAAKAYPAGSWQAVAQELLDRDAAGVPAIFRGTREQQFVQDVLGRGFRTLTQAQEVWLRDIAGRSGMSW